MKTLHKQFVVSVTCSAILAACGGSSTNEPVTPVLAEVPELEVLQSSLSPLDNSASKVERVLKNGVYLRSQQPLVPTYQSGVPEVTTDSKSSNFSTTITQESNVDEADRIKYNGDYLYVVSNGNYPHLNSIAEGANTADSLPEGAVSPALVRVMQRQNDDSLVVLDDIQVLDEDDNGYINGIYLTSNRLAAVFDQYNYSIQSFTGGPAIDIWRPFEQNFGIQFQDISSPEATQRIEKISVEGFVLSSRRIGNQVIVASSYSPNQIELPGDSETPEGQKQNYNQILNTDISEFLPTYTDAEGNEKPLVTADNCLVPENAKNEDSFDSVVTVSSFNINDGTLTSSTCVVAVMDNFYAASDAIYLFGAVYQDESTSSVIHKFAFTEAQINYAASGNLNGYFGWNQPQLRFSQDGDYLRVVSTQNQPDGERTHHFNVMKQNSDTLELVAQLPNEQQPAAIGKPGEDIYAVRYFNDKAYIVTFLRRDPLYVLDLSDNTAPKVAGELDIPGYSAYLHPLNDDYIFGIGQQVSDAVTRPIENGQETTDNPIEEGAKIELYDVRDPANPVVVNTLVFESGYTPVEWDYHALTYLAMKDNKHRVALPVEKWNTTTDDEGKSVWGRHIGLQMVDIQLGSEPGMTHAGEVVPEYEKEYHYGGWDDRAVIHDDLIYYVHGDYVWQSLWNDPKTVLGPY